MKTVNLKIDESKYFPELIYLVEKHGCFVHPKFEGYIAGVQIWNWSEIQFQNYLTANQYAKKVNGKVIKLRVYAVEEKFKKSKTAKTD